MAHEGLHSLKTQRFKRVVVKIDISKDFDWVRLIYIRMLLTHLGFCYDFIKWIVTRLTMVSFSAHINGSSSPFFTARCGLRQGCPLSSLLFLLLDEGLIRFILAANNVGSFKGIPISEVLFITHLLFVDDILIFCDGTHQDIIKLKQGILLLQVPIGMLLNDEKYTISYSNLYGQEILWHSSLFSFKSLQLEDGLKYFRFFLKPSSYCIVGSGS